MLYDLEILQNRPRKEQGKVVINRLKEGKKQNHDSNVDKDGDFIMSDLKEDDKDGFREEDRYEHIEEELDEEKELFEIENGQKDEESKKDKHYNTETGNTEGNKRSDKEENREKNLDDSVRSETNDSTSELTKKTNIEECVQQDHNQTSTDTNEFVQNELSSNFTSLCHSKSSLLRELFFFQGPTGH